MITEDYVSFETAKLLKEKGFNEQGIYYYDFMGDVGNSSSGNVPWNLSVESIYARPTQALAIKWLRVEHNIHIYSLSFYASEKMIFFACISWIKENTYHRYQLENEDIKILSSLGISTGKIFPSPEEATEAAILYTVKNIL